MVPADAHSEAPDDATDGSVRRSEQAFALVLFAVAVLAIVRGWHYGIIRDDGIAGPGFLPTFAGLVLGVASGAIAIRSFRGSLAPPAPSLDQPLASEAGELPEGIDTGGSRRSVAIVLGALIVGLLLERWLGLLVCLSGVVFVALAWAERRGVIKAAVIAVVVGALSWLVFVHYLEVPMTFGVFDAK